MVEPLISPNGDFRTFFHSAANMREIPDESVDCITTSPPYALGLRYEGYHEGAVPSEGQIEKPTLSLDDYEAYLKRMEPIWDECWRVLAPGGYACINFINAHSKAEFFGHAFTLPIYEDVMYYWRKKLGAEYKWQHIWLTTRTAHNAGGESFLYMGSYPQPLEGQVIRLAEFVGILRKLPPDGWEMSEERKARRRKSLLTKEQWRDSHNQLWTFPGVRADEHKGITHPASFPLELPMRCIRSQSVVGDTILDPFLGSGTTLLASRLLGRKCIGYEVEGRYRDMIAEKTHMMGPSIGRPSTLDDLLSVSVTNEGRAQAPYL